MAEKPPINKASLEPIAPGSHLFTYQTPYGPLGEFEVKSTAYETLLRSYGRRMITPALFCVLTVHTVSDERLPIIPASLGVKNTTLSKRELGEKRQEYITGTEMYKAFIDQVVERIYPYVACAQEGGELPAFWEDDGASSPCGYILMKVPVVHILEGQYGLDERPRKLTNQDAAEQYAKRLHDEQKITYLSYEKLIGEIRESNLPHQEGGLTRIQLN